MKAFPSIFVCFAAIAWLVSSSSAPALAQQKTVKACQDEWRANKEANQAAKITEKAYVEKCRADSAKPATATTPPAASPNSSATAPKPVPTPMAPPARQTGSSQVGGAGAAPGANQFTSEAQAKSHCPSDTVVYVNLNSKIYHFAGHKDYGHLKNGTYMCEKDTTTVGARAAKNEKRP